MAAAEHTTLDGVEILEPLSDDKLRALERECRWRNYAAEEQIIDRDSDTSDVYFVIDGRVRVVNYSYSGREVSYDDIGSGNVFGELAAIDGAPRSANVVALAPTTVAALPHEQFRKLLADSRIDALQYSPHVDNGCFPTLLWRCHAAEPDPRGKCLHIRQLVVNMDALVRWEFGGSVNAFAQICAWRGPLGVFHQADIGRLKVFLQPRL